MGVAIGVTPLATFDFVLFLFSCFLVSFFHSFLHSFIPSLSQSVSQQISRYSILCFFHLFFHPYIQLFTRSFIHSFIHSFVLSLFFSLSLLFFYNLLLINTVSHWWQSFYSCYSLWQMCVPMPGVQPVINVYPGETELFVKVSHSWFYLFDIRQL